MNISILGQFVDVDGVKIHYEKVGTGPRVLLLLPGGIGTSRTDFSIQLSNDKGLDKNLFTMIAWDPPGYGFSRPPQRLYDSDVYKRDAHMAAKLMSQLGYNYYSVLGWSDGAKTGLLMAINYASSIDKLVIWGGNAYVVSQEKRVINAIRDIRIWNPQTRYFYEAVYGNELPVLWNKHCDHYINNLDDICRNQVHNIMSPTFVLHGDLDPLPLEHPLFLCKTIADSRLYRFKSGSHNIHQEFSEEFNKMVTNFLLEDNY
ncbi:valacyclovir hydrolase-like [Oppia nitens]|uniref:valacyclovir hydrolase-like n=1 Tax=Oppia nitens TaxID=1686743 RepID=UPI0023DB0439|nr:valacyclovir hydrolase-like [Oppia nitens]